MAKRETKETYKDTKAARDTAQANYETAIGGSQAEQNRLSSQGAAGRAGLETQYNTLLDPNSFKPISFQAVSADTSNLQSALGRAREFGDTGGFTPGREASVMESVGNLKDIGRTGGIDPALRARILGLTDEFSSYKFDPNLSSPVNNAISSLSTIGQTGGLSDENIARMRGNGGFDEFARTGGYTPESIANIKAQALSPIGSYATSTRDELARRRSLQGGYAPGFDAANRQLQRDTSRAIADTSLAANVGIQDRINAGRQWGIGGLSSAEGALAGLQSSNRLNALGQSGNLGLGLADLVSGRELGAKTTALGGIGELAAREQSGRIAGSQGAASVELQLQSLISQYRAQGLSMEQATARAIDDLNSQAAMTNAQGQFAADQYNSNLQNLRLQAGIGGLQGLYNTDVGQYQNERDRANALLGGQTQSNLSYLNNQGQLAMQPGIGSNVVSAIGGLAGVAGNIFGGGFGGGINPNGVRRPPEGGGVGEIQA